ncbi:MAG: hypothetical protein AAF869_07855 [Pseudomonadota bacterium]
MRPTLAHRPLLAGALGALGGALFGVILVALVSATAPRADHGVARVLFPPWIAKTDAEAKIERAGGLILTGERAGPLYAAVTAQPNFTLRLRAEGAWLVFFATP